MATLRVSVIEGDLLEVREVPGTKWWTVFAPTPKNRLIMGSTGRKVSLDGAQGRRLLAAVEEFRTHGGAPE